jgi:hypothetical protein
VASNVPPVHALGGLRKVLVITVTHPFSATPHPGADLDRAADPPTPEPFLPRGNGQQDLEELLDRRVNVLTGQSAPRAARPHPGRVATAVEDERVYLGHIRDAITISRMHIGEPRQPALNDARLRVEAQARFN